MNTNKTPFFQTETTSKSKENEMGIQDYPSNRKENGKDWIFTAENTSIEREKQRKGDFVDVPLPVCVL